MTDEQRAGDRSVLAARSVGEGRCDGDVGPARRQAAGHGEGDAHAGRTETSLLLAIDAAAVRLELAEPGCIEPIERLLPRVRAEGVRPVSSNGVLGDPAGATAEEGRDLLDALVTDLVAAVTERWPDS